MSDTRELIRQFKNSTQRKKSTQAILYQLMVFPESTKTMFLRKLSKKKKRKKIFQAEGTSRLKALPNVQHNTCQKSRHNHEISLHKE